MASSEAHGRHFQDELEQLKARLLEMGGLAEEQVRLAVKGLVHRDRDLVARVLIGDDPLNALHIEVDNRCFTLLALYQPMAVDLRGIVAAVKINTDLERVGDLAINIAEAVVRYMRHAPLKPLIDIPRLARMAQDMVRQSLDSFVRRDAGLARQVIARDDEVDMLTEQSFRELLTYMLEDSRNISRAIRLTFVGKYFERMADAATNICEMVVYLVEGKVIKHSNEAP